MKSLGVLKRKIIQFLKLDFTDPQTNKAPYASLITTGLNTGSSFSSANNRMNLLSSAYDGLTIGVPYNKSLLRQNFDLRFTLSLNTSVSGRILTIDDNGSGDYSLALNYVAGSGLVINTSSGTFFPITRISAYAVIANNTGCNCYIKYRACSLFTSSFLEFYINNALVIFHTVAMPPYGVYTPNLKFGGFGATSSAYGYIDNIDMSIVRNKFRTVCDLQCNFLPFEDTSGKNSVTNYGVTVDNERAYFNNPTNTSTAALHIYTLSSYNSDFRLQGDFNIFFDVVVDTFSGKTDQLLFSITSVSDPSDPLVVECYIKNTGRIYLNFPNNLGGLVTYFTAEGTIVAGTTYRMRIEKTGDLAQIWVNDTRMAISTPVIPPLTNITRTLILGARVAIGGWGLNGKMDNFLFLTE